ncbi:hypothetical protein L3X38_001638 [Prunus dulcis]|uniref:Integrase catalytic domain-containing protein n=1 Tax=Prunus dulcis TaxID=3755 RepID=A0AAD4WUS6_PRUDU|nr:hypothetical protein L3X38_001638 [Prunus dulcis]
MPQGKGQVKYAVVAVDYFTKWVEAEPLATITAAKIEDFVWTHICCRFGIPYAIITDNGRQFDSELFRKFCTRLKINLFFASPAHPQSNGQVEAINKIVKKLLKRQLDKAKGAWPEKLPEALWAIRTSYRTTATNLQGRTKFPSEEPSEENLGDYCLYRILPTNDHLTRGRSQHLTLQALRQGHYRIIRILVLMLLDTCHAHNPLLQSHIGDSKIHTPPKAYIRRPLFPKEEEQNDRRSAGGPIEPQLAKSDHLDLDLSNDIKGIMSALHQIQEKAHKDGLKKNEETISSVRIA